MKSTLLALTMCFLAGCADRVTNYESARASLAPAGKNTTKVGDTVAPDTASKTAMPIPEEIRFKDDIESNVDLPAGLDGLVFIDVHGDRVALESYLGKKNVVLVFTEGFAGGMLCPFCKTQTSRLVANYDKFKELNTEVLVVYPGTRDHLGDFIAAAKQTEKKDVDKVPFPLLLDEKLTAVGFFSIASNLAHPSTFIIDKAGNVRLAYVGADMSADRPSIAAMLETIRGAENEQGTGL